MDNPIFSLNTFSNTSNILSFIPFVFSVLESPDIHNVAVALWGMHDFEAQEKVKKAFGAAKKK